MTDEFIFEIMEKFNASDIVDLDLSHANEHISLRKKEACNGDTVIHNNGGQPFCGTAQPVVVSSNTTATELPKNEAPVEKAAEKKEEKPVEVSETLKSPIVGTFYRAPSPDSPAYAEKGKQIKKGEPVCIIEAMKMMNTLNADFDFEVLDVLVENGELVEFDQPLFAIKKL